MVFGIKVQTSVFTVLPSWRGSNRRRSKKDDLTSVTSVGVHEPSRSPRPSLLKARSSCGGSVEEQKACLPYRVEDPEGGTRSNSSGPVFRRRKTIKGQGEDPDANEVLALLMQLALAVCSADLLDCVAVVRGFAFTEHLALRRVATKVCRELASKGSQGGSARTSVTSKRVESIVSIFLMEQLRIPKPAEPAIRGLSPDASPRDDVGHSVNSIGELKHSATSKTDISVSSFTQFAKERKSFAYRSETFQDIAKAAAAQPQGGVLWRRASNSSIVSRMGGSMDSQNGGSRGSSPSAGSPRSAAIRSLLRSQAERVSEQIGSFTWCMDGAPRDESEHSQHSALAAKALIHRYEEGRRSASAVSLGADTSLPELPSHKSSLINFVLSGRAVSACSVVADRDVVPTPGDESDTTSVLLDRALAGMDITSASRSGPTVDYHHLHSVEEASSFSDSKASKNSKTSVRGEDSPDPSAKERWLQRKADKRERRASGDLQSTYGATIRSSYWQLPPGQAVPGQPRPERRHDTHSPPGRLGGGSPPAAEAESPAHEPESGAFSPATQPELRGRSQSDGMAPKQGASSSTGDQPCIGELFKEPRSQSGPVSSSTSKDAAREKWEKRRAEKRAARAASGKLSYGQLVRMEHEQLLTLDRAD